MWFSVKHKQQQFLELSVLNDAQTTTQTTTHMLFHSYTPTTVVVTTLLNMPGAFVHPGNKYQVASLGKQLGK
jgi:hypothetical protein